MFSVHYSYIAENQGRYYPAGFYLRLRRRVIAPIHLSSVKNKKYSVLLDHFDFDLI